MIKTFVFLGLSLYALTGFAQPFAIEGQGKVTWVADGDTFAFQPDNITMWKKVRARAVKKQQHSTRNLKINKRFRRSNHSFLVRVGNIDTPESVNPDPSRNSPAGRRASRFVKHLLKHVHGTLYCWAIGYYGRPICSLWTPKWELGEVLIKKGYSPYITRYGRHPRFDKQYRAAVKAAQN